MRKIILFIIYLFSAYQISAQQYPLFTNYVLNDFGFNPAIAGTSEYIDIRATYRTQWTGLADAPTTAVFSGHTALDSIPLGIGGYIYNDVAGQIRRTGFSAAFSYGQEMSFGKISLGISGGVYSFRLSDNFLAEQSTDPTLANAMDQKWNPDVSVGVYLTMNNGAFLGFSVPQVMRRKIQFENEQSDLTTNIIPHYYGMAGYKWKLNDKITLEPSVLLKITQAAPLQIDGSLRAFFNEKFWIGGSYRTQDAATAMIGYDLNRRMSIAYAYDYTLSRLKAASNGSHEFTLSLRLGGPKDSDGDGIFDKDDECPDEPGTKENNGCPEEESETEELADRDEDGILDVNDKCPDLKGPKDNKGCPYGDRDKDGIRDEIDKCPSVPGLPEYQGCPKDDRDGDGILDHADKCPDQAGSYENGGCPDGDADGDGIPDIDDNCPNTPGIASRRGCPEVGSLEREILNLVIQNVYFDTDKDKIRSHAYKYLDRLSELLVNRPEWKVAMTGHADSRGTSEHNQDLSKRRVEAVLFYMMNRGVSRRQLITEYYGEEKPAAPNNPDTFYLNRRVEMWFTWD